MITPFNDRRSNVSAEPEPPGGVHVSATGVYRLTPQHNVEPADDVREFKPEVLRRHVIGNRDVITLFLPMRMAGNTFFEVAVSGKFGTEWVERHSSFDVAIKRHAALVKMVAADEATKREGKE